MPLDPIEFRILQNMQTALRGIVAGSTYHHTVASAAVKLDPDHKAELLTKPSGFRPFVILQPGDETWEIGGVGGSRYSALDLTMNVTVHWVNDCDVTDDDSYLETFLKGCADVETALAVDKQRGGLAQFTKFVNRRAERQKEGGSLVWAMVDTQIRIHRSFGLPNG